MIRNQWYAILESNEVKPGKLTGTTRMGENLVFWRDSTGKPVCLVDRCPHRGAAFSKGKLVGDQVQCPFHGFQFDPTGCCTLIPANGRKAPIPKAFQAHSYPARDAFGFIWIWWGSPRLDLPPISFFESIPEEMPFATLKDTWHTHYSRAIENQLDVVHLPFVHATTIGRGNRTLADGPLYQWESLPGGGSRLNLWVYNRVDDGDPPLRLDEIPVPSRRPFLQFIFPNIWHNWISDNVRIVAAFAPIDAENTLMYVRMYQNFMKFPVLRQVANLGGKIGNRIILNQDKRVVETQRPFRSELRMGEKLIQADGPVIAYRRRRDELLRNSEQQ